MHAKSKLSEKQDGRRDTVKRKHVPYQSIRMVLYASSRVRFRQISGCHPLTRPRYSSWPAGDSFSNSCADIAPSSSLETTVGGGGKLHVTVLEAQQATPHLNTSCSSERDSRNVVTDDMQRN